jgi:excisionase family DNA binding protein
MTEPAHAPVTASLFAAGQRSGDTTSWRCQAPEGDLMTGHHVTAHHDVDPDRFASEPTELRRRLGSGATTTPGSCASPLPGTPGQPGGARAPDGAGPTAGEPAGDPVPTLFTPAQAAQLLQVPESWLRRRAARRLVPCTFLGKHLRFSRANLDQIVADAARPASTARRSPSDTGATPRRRGRLPVRTHTDSRRSIR